MSKIPDGVDPDELTKVTRRVLLDTLEVLADHAAAVTIVGAQAVYLRSIDVRLPVAEFTSDADFSLDPTRLKDFPLIDQIMRNAGFAITNKGMPGTWARDESINGRPVPIPVDLLVPESLTPRQGKRGGEIPPHSYDATRRVPGIEAAVVDRDLSGVPSLEPDTDPRVIQAHVAGTAALFIAKAHKIHDRAEQPKADRLVDKDAGDVVRLMMSDAGDISDVAERVRRLRADQRTAETTDQGLRHLADLFDTPSSLGTEMAMRALGDDNARLLVNTYIRDLRDELGESWPDDQCQVSDVAGAVR